MPQAGTRSASRAITSERPARPRPRSSPSPWPTASPTSSWPARRVSASTRSRPRLSFFFNAHIDFFEEIAKYRAARRLWARWMKDRYGAKDERTWKLRFHTQTAGVSLTAQQPEINLAAPRSRRSPACSAAPSRCTPTRWTRRWRSRVRRRGAHRAAHPADHRLRDQRRPRGRPPGRLVVRRGAHRRDGAAGRGHLRRDRRDGSGSMLEGCIRGIEENWFQGRIADSAYELERSFNAGERGSSWASTTSPRATTRTSSRILRITNEDERRQLARLDRVRETRDDAARPPRPGATRGARRGPRGQPHAGDLIECAKACATVGEMMGDDGGVFGRHVEVPTL